VAFYMGYHKTASKVNIFKRNSKVEQMAGERDKVLDDGKRAFLGVLFAYNFRRSSWYDRPFQPSQPPQSEVLHYVKRGGRRNVMGYERLGSTGTLIGLSVRSHPQDRGRPRSDGGSECRSFSRRKGHADERVL